MFADLNDKNPNAKRAKGHCTPQVTHYQKPFDSFLHLWCAFSVEVPSLAWSALTINVSPVAQAQDWHHEASRADLYKALGTWYAPLFVSAT